MFPKKHLACFLFVAAFILVFSLPQPSRAQVPGILGMPSMHAEFKMPEVGTYVKYTLSDTKNRTESSLKLSIVGKETIKGEGEFFWYEVEQTDSKTGSYNVFKMLISGDPQAPGAIRRMIYKSGKEPANELPQAFVALMNQAPKDTGKATTPKAKDVGTEQVKTKAGTFTCVHSQDFSKGKQATDTWTSAKVPMFGIVRSIAGTTTLELLEHGTGAATAIKEKPRVLEMPGQE